MSNWNYFILKYFLIPQIAPIRWTILFLIFSLSFVIFNIINFYNKNFFININKIETNKNNELKKINIINWKW